MIFRFENPGHRDHLQSLGLLQPEETEVLAVTLAQRLIQSKRMVEGLYIIKQEMAHHLTNYNMLGNILTIADESAHRVSDQQTYQEAITWLQRVAGVVRSAAEQTEAAQTLIEAFELMQRARTPNIRLEPQALHYLREITQLIQRLMENRSEKEVSILGQIEALQRWLDDTNRSD